MKKAILNNLKSNSKKYYKPKIKVTNITFGVWAGGTCGSCLSSITRIHTPLGQISIQNLKMGMKIYSLDRYGRKIIQPIIKLSKIYVNYNHKVNHLILEDGRNIWVSPLHPSYYFSLVKNLKKGDFYDGAKIITNKIVRYGDKYTYDLLPKGETGYYWANRILLASTLLPVMQSQEQAYIKPVLYLHQV